MYVLHGFAMLKSSASLESLEEMCFVGTRDLTVGDISWTYGKVSQDRGEGEHVSLS